MAIYTKTGDKGNTKVFDKKTGQLVPVRKSSCKIKSIGAIDELNSMLGVVKSFSDEDGSPSDKSLNKKIEEIQSNLFTINSILAGSKLRFSKVQTKRLEKQIDEWEGFLPVQKNFIYYGGSQVSSLIFYARALTRKAERSLVAFAKKEPVSESIRIYMNRLSDYLFMMGRIANNNEKVKEVYWKGYK